MPEFPITLVVLILTALAATSRAFDNSRYDNNVVYWGQNSYGAVNKDDTANWQKTLSYYCQDNAADVIPISFITNLNGTGNEPVMNLANTCNNKDNATFPGTDLPDCSALASDLKACQSKGKILTLSLGGGGSYPTLGSDGDANNFADLLWNQFLGGSSDIRPFGDAILDGIDLDIESSTSAAFITMVDRLQSHFSGASKKYYVTAAPQCVYPDQNIQTILNGASLDAIYVQFYNNPCGLNTFGSPSGFNFGIWDYWARNVSPNKNVKVYVGGPASTTAAGSGYQDPDTLISILNQTRNSFPSFGGAMLWDFSQSDVNDKYAEKIKSGLVDAGGTGFTFPPCSAPTYSSGSVYTQGQQASYQGYVWEAKWWTQATPAADPNNDWSPISACQGASTTSVSTAPGTPATATPNNSTVCAGVVAWNSDMVYQGNSQVTYNNALWTSKWWTQGETPSSDDVWSLMGTCATSSAVKRNIETGLANSNKRRVETKTIPKHAGPDFEENDATNYWRSGAGLATGRREMFARWFG